MNAVSYSLRAIALSIAYLSASSMTCSAAGIEPLDGYLKRNDFIRNPQVVQYVYLRCASLYAFLGVAAQSDPDFQSQAESFRNKGDQFLGALVGTEHGADVAKSELFILIAKYRNRYANARTEGSGLLSDKTIRSDLQMCSTLFANLQAL